MKGIYISTHSLSLKCSGVVKKIHQQLECFKENGIDCAYYSVSPSHNKSFFGKLLRRLPFFSFNSWNTMVIDSTIDFYYFRKPTLEGKLFKYFRRIRQTNKKIRIIMEFPTFPYDKEYKPKDFFLKLKDSFWRKRLSKYVDKIVTYSKDKTIFGIETIETFNGYDFENGNAALYKKSPCNTINLIAIGTANYFWYGYDRLISGLRLYYDNNPAINVKLFLVGNVTCYDQLIDKLDLKDCVVKKGSLTSNDLQELYSTINIAFDTLGWHRTGGVSISSSLKSREYGANGIPIIISGKNDIFSQNECDFSYEVPSDDSPIDIKKVISFYQQLLVKYHTDNQLAHHIREFSKSKYDMSTSMERVILYCKEMIK